MRPPDGDAHDHDRFGLGRGGRFDGEQIGCSNGRPILPLVGYRADEAHRYLNR